MSDKPTHPLTLRQLSKCGLSADAPPSLEAWQHFLARVDAAYHEEDSSRYLVERSIAISTKEMRELNDALRAYSGELANQKQNLEQSNHALTRLVNYDPLTDLPNRASFLADLNAALSNDTSPIVIFIDLDGFKLINDSLGHAAGDAILKIVGTRISESVRRNDEVARFAGDEFTVMLHDISMDDVGIVCEKLLLALARPYSFDGHDCYLTASVGVAQARVGERNGDEVIKQADWAMYTAKASGKNQFHVYSSDIDERVVKRLALSHDLRHAIDRQELFLHYQPCVSLATGQCVSVEALLRWQSPEHGAVPPSAFISIAEDTGLIHRLGDFVFEQACAQARVWECAGLGLRVAVNVSAKQLAKEDFVEQVAAVLTNSQLTPSRLELEITESAAMANIESTIVKLNRLRAMGVQIAIDDFGTAYSSLNYLKRLPVDRLKIDRSFISDLSDPSPRSTSVVRAIMALAKGVNVRIIAEGVETQEQLALLRSFGCDEVQGFLFCKPMPANRVIQRLDYAALLEPCMA